MYFVPEKSKIFTPTQAQRALSTNEMHANSRKAGRPSAILSIDFRGRSSRVPSYKRSTHLVMTERPQGSRVVAGGEQTSTIGAA